jgi:hypothetical protein
MNSTKAAIPSLPLDDFVVPKKEISLHYLKIFVEEHEKVISESKMTTEDVVYKIIIQDLVKKNTQNGEDQGCSLCNKLLQSPDTSSYVGDATIFISHS